MFRKLDFHAIDFTNLIVTIYFWPDSRSLPRSCKLQLLLIQKVADTNSFLFRNILNLLFIGSRYTSLLVYRSTRMKYICTYNRTCNRMTGRQLCSDIVYFNLRSLDDNLTSVGYNIMQNILQGVTSVYLLSFFIVIILRVNIIPVNTRNPKKSSVLTTFSKFYIEMNYSLKTSNVYVFFIFFFHRVFFCIRLY